MDYLDSGCTSSDLGDLLYEVCKSFIEKADNSLLSKDIDCSTYAEITKLKYSFLENYEIEISNL